MWAAGDAQIMELARIGNELHQQVRDGRSTPQTTAPLLAAAERVHRQCVEDAGALNALAMIGVDFAQGFHLCKPVRLTEIEDVAMGELRTAGSVHR